VRRSDATRPHSADADAADADAADADAADADAADAADADADVGAVRFRKQKRYSSGVLHHHRGRVQSS
jgi:hypothetical protein